MIGLLRASSWRACQRTHVANRQGLRADTARMSVRGFCAAPVRSFVPFWQWPRARKLLRALRVGGLVAGVYSFGFAAGEMEAAANPAKHRRQSIETIMRQSGAWDTRTGRPMVLPPDSIENKCVVQLLPRILGAAQEEVIDMAQEVKSSDLSPEAQALELARLEEVSEMLTSEWFAFVLDVDSVNAFVTAMAPRTVFIMKGIFTRSVWKAIEDEKEAWRTKVGSTVVTLATIGSSQLGVWMPAEVLAVNDMRRCQGGMLLQINGESEPRCVTDMPRIKVEREMTVLETEEQLALLLAHELSHAVHGHSEHRVRLLAALAGVQLVVLSILDPLGLSSLLAEMFLPFAAQYAAALPFSRQHELEADATGLRICARAGFDPDYAAELLDRLKATSLPGESAPSWVSTHPSYDRRSEALSEGMPSARALFQNAVPKR